MANHEQRVFTFKLTHLIWWFFGVVEGLIGLRVLLKLLAANQGSPFTQFIYNITAPFLWPFQALTATPSVGDVVFEIPAIIAMIVYAFAAWALVRVVLILLYTPPQRSQPVDNSKTTVEVNEYER